MLGNFGKRPQCYLLKWMNIAFLKSARSTKSEVPKDEAASTPWFIERNVQNENTSIISRVVGSYFAVEKLHGKISRIPKYFGVIFFSRRIPNIWMVRCGCSNTNRQHKGTH